MDATNSLLELLAGDNGRLLRNGLLLTLALTAVCSVGAFALGMLLAVLRETGSRTVSALAASYVAFHRNAPLLVHVLFWYFGITTLLPTLVQDWINRHGGGLIPGSIALILCMAAYIGEDLRSGLRTVSAGQTEAARASGLGHWQAMGYVVLPQALRASLPALTSRSVSLFKGTSVLMAIGVAELTYAVKLVDSQTYRTFAVFAIGSVAYLLVSLALMTLGHRLEKRFALK